MSYSTAQIWLIVAVMGVGTYLIRFSFLGLIGGRKLPDWLLRHLRYTPVAVLPGLVAPLVVWPTATDGTPHAAYMAAALMTLGMGWWRKSVMGGAIAGAVTLGVLLWMG